MCSHISKLKDGNNHGCLCADDNQYEPQIKLNNTYSYSQYFLLRAVLFFSSKRKHSQPYRRLRGYSTRGYKYNIPPPMLPILLDKAPIQDVRSELV